MEQQNLFENDWIDCLRAHYAHVIREQDTNNEQSLVSVLLETGFTDNDIETMRSEVRISLGIEDEPSEEEITTVEEDEYDWVLSPEPKIALADESVYEWVLPPEESQSAGSIEAAAETQNAVVETAEPQSAVEAVEPEVEAHNEEEPPESFVQMSLF